MLKRLVKEIFKCRHKNALLSGGNEGYCPDCGKYVKKAYYIIRCDCCGIKRSAKKSFDEIAPTEKFCTNCGSKEYIVEKYERLNLVDINYAIETKETVEEKGPINELEIWVDEVRPEKTRNEKSAPVMIGQMKYLTG